MSHWVTRKVVGALVVTMLLAMALPWVAVADDISNNLDATVDAVAEVMALNAGGTNGTTQLYVTPANGDGKNGCNLTGSTTLVLSVSSSNTSVATVSPSSVTFASCGDTKTLTVTPVSQGSATISVSQTSNNTDGAFNLAPATFTVNVTAPAPSNTAPQVSISGVTGGASYDKGAVPSATCQMTDAEDGNSTFAATLSAITGTYAADGIGSQTASCSYTDGGGLTASASETYAIVDPSAPSIGYTLNPAVADGANGWYTSDVTLTWTVTENESPSSLQKTDCFNQAITADQGETAYSCSATSAGGTATQVNVTIKRDATAPSAPVASINPVPNSAGWNTTAVTVSFAANGDNLSGVASCTAPVTVADPTLASEILGTCTDNAGNISSSSSKTVKIDTAKPVITSNTGTYTPGAWTNQDVVVGFSCADAGAVQSGIATNSVAGAAVSTEGANQSVTNTGTCVDAAGNVADAATVSDIDIDKTAPTLAPSISPIPVLLNGAATATANATDTLSGIASQSCGTVNTSSVGSKSVTCSATDNAGNTNSANANYSVGYQFIGFSSPVDNNGVLNAAKAGQAIPLKWRLLDANNNPVLNLSSVMVTVKTLSCSTGMTADEVEEYAAGLSGLQSLGNGYYQFNWKSPTTYANSCKTLQLDLGEGSPRTANFQFKK